MPRTIAIILTAGAVGAFTLAAGCGSTDDTHNYGRFTDCGTIGRLVTTTDPTGDQRRTNGTPANAAPMGDLVQLDLARGDGKVCAEFTTNAQIRPYAAFVLTMRPQDTDTPLLQLEAVVLAGQAPSANLDVTGTGESFKKIPATVGIDGDRLSIVVTRAPFARAGPGAAAIFDSFRFQARSAVATRDQGRVTDCLPVCQ
jgi:hypothetical protein